MPDLHTDAVHAFWDSYDRRTLYRIVVALEKMEHWSLDQIPEVEAALIQLGEQIDQAEAIEALDEEKFVRILLNTRAPRAFRILQSIDMVKPGTASGLLMHAEEASKREQNPDAGAQLFLRRNLVFERLQLLSRLFSPNRIFLILNALENLNE
jgi:intracellular multiplication protein IcmW